jgi:hypothetical protein
VTNNRATRETFSRYQDGGGKRAIAIKE